MNIMLGGRGAGKTAALVMKANILASMSPGIKIILTEQTSRDIRDILEPTWSSIVDSKTHLSRGQGSDTCKHYHNGSQVWFRSRQARKVNDTPPFHGMDVGWVGHDELTLDKRADVITVSRAMIRQPGSMFLGMDITASPRPSWVKQSMMGMGLVKPITCFEDRVQISDSGNHLAVYVPTSSNRYNSNLHYRLAPDMSAQDVETMLGGTWGSHDGACWDFLEEEWPRGNMVDLPYQPQLPYILGVDLGGTDSAWGLFQKVDLTTGMKKVPCLVLMAEWTPHKKKPWGVIDDIKAFTSSSTFRDPEHIYIGVDYKTPGGTGDTPMEMFAQAGWGTRARIVSGWTAGKDIQDMQASALIHNAAGQRRFCISKRLKSFYPGPTRGLLDVMRNDTYPEPGYPHYFRKEKDDGIFHEDSRDYFLYATVSINPPKYRPQENWGSA
jgi:hypothetical protein